MAGWGEFELEVIRDRNDNVVIDLLDRERRPDGRAHRRLGHRRPGPDALRPRVPGAARRLRHRDPRGGRRDRRLQRPVRAQPRHRRAGRDRDEPARLALARRWPPRRPAIPIAKVATKLASATRWTRSPTTSPGRRRPRSSPRSTTWWSSCRGSRSRSSPARTTSLTTQMKSVGEAMGIGRTLQRGLGQGDALPRAGRHRRASAGPIAEATWDRFDVIAGGLLAGDEPAAAGRRVAVHPWFLDEWALVAEAERVAGRQPTRRARCRPRWRG